LALRIHKLTVTTILGQNKNFAITIAGGITIKNHFNLHNINPSKNMTNLINREISDLDAYLV
jgi:hypothetical protein